MAKKQTRRSISVSRTTYERLKAFCEANNVSMSQLVETRVNDFLGESPVEPPRPVAPRPMASLGGVGIGGSVTSSPAQPAHAHTHVPHSAHVPHSVPSLPPRPVMSMPAKPPVEAKPAPVAQPVPSSQPVPMTSAAARIAVEPPPPIIKPRQETAAPKPAEKRPDQIFTF